MKWWNAARPLFGGVVVGALVVTVGPLATAATGDGLRRGPGDNRGALVVPREEPVPHRGVRVTSGEQLAMPASPNGEGAWPSGSATLLPGSGSARDDALALRWTAESGTATEEVAARLLDRESAHDVGIEGVLVQVAAEVSEVVSAASGPTGPVPNQPEQAVDVTIERERLADAFGGEWASRARLVELPACALTSPEKAGCRTQTPVEGAVGGMALSARVSAAGSTVLAVTAGASGSNGSWAATPLSPSATWDVTEQAGDFSWSYPLAAPPGVGGPEPEIALSYSSGSLDGKVAGTNTQASWVGDGWSLEAGYVERRYVSCSQDAGTGANNVDWLTGDLCWKTDNATLVLGGRASELVKDATTGAWKLKSDDGTRIERLTGAWNGDDDKEYWKVTTTDGTQYYFGRDRRSASDALVLNSAWSVPVFGNNPGEPCYSPSFAASWCTQTWRWNLDYVVDANGNTMTYVYDKETNNYGRNLGEATSTYDRGGHIALIDYGQRASSEAVNAPQRVEFTVEERCLPSGSISCDPGQLTSANKKSWPDVPFDQICVSARCSASQVSPTFFTRKRLAGVTTKVLSGAAYQDVDTWTFKHGYPDPGDGTSPALWLESITRTGRNGTPVALSPVTFHGVQMANRVDTIGDHGPAMNRYRIDTITTEAGGLITVGYTPVDCTASSLPASPDTNTRRCFPVRWTPEGTSQQLQEYFHKYLVTSVVRDGRDGQSVPVETAYSYIGSPAWHYEDSPLLPEKERTWREYRGYGTVDVFTGASSTTRSHTRYRYFRGMHGDPTASGIRVESVDGIPDDDRLSGFVRAEIVYDGARGTEISRTTSSPWTATTAVGADGSKALLLGQAMVEERVVAPAAPGGARTTRTVTTYDANFGLPTQIDDLGDVATPSDDRCTRIEYARNHDAHIVETTSRSETVGVACTATPSRPADVLGDTRTGYDGLASGDAPTRGLVSTVEELSGYSGINPIYTTRAQRFYDAQGRETSSIDAIGRTTSTAYSPATGGPLTSTRTTSPDPDGSGPLAAHVTVSVLDPARGLPVKETDANGKVTTATYDALGRTTQVWLPGRAQSSKSAHQMYAYSVAADGQNSITTKTLTSAETYRTTITHYDGLLRERQTQRPSSDRNTPGRMVTNTVYDARGLVAYTNGEWFTTGAPSSPAVIPTEAVPLRTRFEYDGAGRQTVAITDINHQERWRTVTTYGGDRVSVDPPDGASPTTTLTDARGQVTERREHSGADLTGDYVSSKFAYDGAGRLTATSDAAGNRWTYQYDLMGRQVYSADPDRGIVTVAYDAADQVTSVTDARGVTLTYAYDALGRRTSVREGGPSGALRASWVHDTVAKGHLTSSTRHQGGVQYVRAVTGYDDGYRPLGVSLTIPSVEGSLAGTYTTTYTYTADGQLKSYRLPTAGGLGVENVQISYDAANQPDALSGGIGYGVYVTTTTWSARGEPMQYRMGTSANHIATLTHGYEEGTRRLSSTVLARSNGNGYDRNVTYAYDAAGNPTSVVDRPTAKPVDAQCFRYDGLRRLATAWTPASADCAANPAVGDLGGPAPYWASYTYDAIGNRTTEALRNAISTVDRTYTYPAAGAPRPHAVQSVTQTGTGGATTSTFAYDAAGNTVARAPGGATAQTLEWDAEGDLAAVLQGAGVTGAHLYDADGDRLIRRQGGTVTAYLPGGVELTLTSATGTVKATRYYSFGGRVVAVRTGAGSAGTSTLVSDTHSTAEIAIANGTNAVTQRRLDPFGNPRGTTPTWPGDRGFLNKPVDATGLVQVGARYYDAAIGRFISVDPVMDLSQSQQWAAYSYANNNPVTYSDPTGLLPRLSALAGGGTTPWFSGSTRSATGAPSLPPSVCAVHPMCRTQAAASWAKQNKETVLDAAPIVGTVRFGQQSTSAFRSGDFSRWGSGAAGATGWVRALHMEISGAALTAVGGGAVAGGLKAGMKAAKRTTAVSGTAANTGVAAIAASPRVAPWAGNSLSRLSTEGETMYRVWGGGADQAGSWLTPIRPLSSAAAREGLALPAENAATYVSRVTLPPGVRMQVGTAGPAFGQSGGWAQAQLLERIPLSSFGTGEVFP